MWYKVEQSVRIKPAWNWDNLDSYRGENDKFLANIIQVARISLVFQCSIAGKTSRKCVRPNQRLVCDKTDFIRYTCSKFTQFDAQQADMTYLKFNNKYLNVQI